MTHAWPALFMLVGCRHLTAAHAQTSSAESYPSRPIRMIVPFTPGSATDIIARIITPKLAETWGRPVVVDNRPSAGGIVAFKIVAEALPDGHTLTTTGSNYAGAAALYAGKLPYDPVKDFAGVTQLASTPLILVVAPSLGAKSVKDLIALARSKPGQFNFGSTGLGSGPHYGAELFNLAADVKAVHVPYRGSPEAMTDIMAGRVHYMLSPVLSAVPLVRSGRLLALGVTTAQRASGVPEVPTIAEAGSAVSNTRAGTVCSRRARRRARSSDNSRPKSRVSLKRPTRRNASRVKVRTRRSSTPEEFDKLVREEIVTRIKVWKAAGVKPE